MSKTIKRIMSSLLVVAAFATVEPANYINLMTEKAYASNDNKQDSIYLDELKLTDRNNLISFNRKVTAYEVNVNEDCDNLIVKAKQDDSGDNVRVNDGEVDSNNNKRVYLEKGKNVIKIKVYNDENSGDNDYKQRTYTITVNRGTTTDTTANTINNTTNTNSINNNTANTSSNSSTTTNSTINANQWVKNVNNQWIHNDFSGKPQVNTWYYDNSYGKWYKFGYDGVMCTGWQVENGKIYYLNEDGSMQIGGKYIAGAWYNFDISGAMI